MPVGELPRRAVCEIRENGVKGFRQVLQTVYRGSWRICAAPLAGGENIFEHDWDLLIILDGCRMDLLYEAAADWLFINEVDSLQSVGSQSKEWLANTFVPRYADVISQTVYITANPFSAIVFDLDTSSDNNSRFNPANWKTVTSSDFCRLEELWRDSWDDNLGTVLPRPVTDRAIEIARQVAPERLIVHYMQPHQPFIGVDPPLGIGDDNVWTAIKHGKLNHDEVWKAYSKTLDTVLEDVDLLLSNVDAERAVVTADHGNAVGEWGIYGHPIGFLHPAVRRVPWAVTSAIDEQTYDPEIKLTSNTNNDNNNTVSDRLQALGYLEE